MSSMKIIVNAKEKEVNKKFMYYFEVCKLAGKEPFLNPTISYKCDKYSGTLTQGMLLEVADGMIINVINT